MGELYDGDGYPTEYGLDRLRTFQGTPRQFVAFVESMWWPQGQPMSSWTEIGPTLGGKYIYHWYIATGGWSGNEEIIGEIEKCMFWFMYWQQSTRGGAYSFHIPRDQADTTMNLGLL